MLIAVLTTIFFIEPKVALFGILGFGSLYGLAILISKKFLKRNSASYAVEMVLVNKAIQEGMGGIRDIIIDGTQKIFTNFYAGAVTRMQMAAAGNVALSQLPRYFIEIFGMFLLAGIALVMSERDGGVMTAIPALGVIALSVQRLLPVLQQAYSAYASIRGGVDSTLDALYMLDQAIPCIPNASKTENIIFRDMLSIKDIKFSYEINQKFILDGINIDIPQGCCVGIIGASGGGKSTLVDLIMGLLTPSFGKILVDSCALGPLNMKSWQSCISHVPQHIFLADATIAENIAFGVEKQDINWDRVSDAAKIAQISEVIELLPNAYLTKVGERGIKLSGGQRQRIGIARAIYKRSKLLILDEATSALDGQIEESVMNAISALGGDVTMILIAHRISILKYCDFIVEMKDGKVIWTGSYPELEVRVSL
jgi:ATP-binding cassette subfamily B protein